jgi:heptaprenyl diphosphate synthase
MNEGLTAAHGEYVGVLEPDDYAEPGMFAALYSLAGSVTSFLVMYLLKKTDLFSVIGVSTAGGVFHNIGQLCVAIYAVSGPQLIHYLPVLIISGMIAGIIVGIGAAVLLDRIPAKLFRE